MMPYWLALLSAWETADHPAGLEPNVVGRGADVSANPAHATAVQLAARLVSVGTSTEVSVLPPVAVESHGAPLVRTPRNTRADHAQPDEEAEIAKSSVEGLPRHQNTYRFKPLRPVPWE
jgi:hypothetical protein